MGFAGDKSVVCLLLCFSFLRGAEGPQNSGLSYITASGRVLASS